MTDPDAATAVRERYRRFARDEAPGRSALYAEWATGVAGDPAAAATLARIAPSRRPPPLVFAVTRLLGAPETSYRKWAAWLAVHADEVVAECHRRSIQTNEPLRCAALLPALSLITGPIALVEVGASAGLCMYPDRYSYRYASPDGSVIALDPPDGPSPVVLSSRLLGARRPPLRMPEVVWRAGIDLHPLDPRDPQDREWVTGLVWPGETGRVERMTAALGVAAADPPVIHRGDAVDVLDAVASTAPRGATLVVTTPGVLAHIDATSRDRLIRTAGATGRWITLDAAGLHSAWHPPIDAPRWPEKAFALALDGEVLAAADPLGGFVEWRADEPAPRR